MSEGYSDDEESQGSTRNDGEYDIGDPVWIGDDISGIITKILGNNSNQFMVYDSFENRERRVIKSRLAPMTTMGDKSEIKSVKKAYKEYQKEKGTNKSSRVSAPKKRAPGRPKPMSTAASRSGSRNIQRNMSEKELQKYTMCFWCGVQEAIGGLIMLGIGAWFLIVGIDDLTHTDQYDLCMVMESDWSYCGDSSQYSNSIECIGFCERQADYQVYPNVEQEAFDNGCQVAHMSTDCGYYDETQFYDPPHRLQECWVNSKTCDVSETNPSTSIAIYIVLLLLGLLLCVGCGGCSIFYYKKIKDEGICRYYVWGYAGCCIIFS